MTLRFNAAPERLAQASVVSQAHVTAAGEHGRVLSGGQLLCGLSESALQEAPGPTALSTSSAQRTPVEASENGQAAATHLLFFPIDVDECLHEELNACSGRELCLNTEGSYQCVHQPEEPASSPQKLDGTCEGKRPQDVAKEPFRLMDRGPLRFSLLTKVTGWLMGRE